MNRYLNEWQKTIILKTPENFFTYKKINDLGGDAPPKINDLQTFPEFSGK